MDEKNKNFIIKCLAIVYNKVAGKYKEMVGDKSPHLGDVISALFSFSININNVAEQSQAHFGGSFLT